MYLLIDNLNAMIVLGAVLLMLLFLRQRMVEVNVEQLATYTVKKQAVDLATWLEDDLLTVGENMNLTEKRFEDPKQSGLNTTEFTFYRDSVDTSAPAGTAPIRIATRYTLAPAGTRTLQGESISVYQLIRETRENSGSWKEDGRTAPLLSYFRIDMLNGDVLPISKDVVSGKEVSQLAIEKPDTLRNTRVRFTMVTPIENERTTLRKYYYGSTLMLPN